MRLRASVTLACCLLVSIVAAAQQPQGTPPQNQPAPDPARELTAPDIPGVVAGGTKVQFIRAGFNGTEGVIAMPDGSVLFTEQDANRILRIDPAGNLSTYLEDTNRTVGLAYDAKGRLIAAQSREPRIGVLAPTRMVIADSFEGQPLVRPNDLVIDKKGGIYFSDPIPNPQAQFRDPPSGRKPLLFYITPAGTVTKLTEYITAPNGVQLSPDERILYATNGNHIVAFDIQPDGSVTNPRKFAETGGDGMAIDNAGRLYTAVGDGIRVVSPQGQILGTIPTPVGMQSIGFAGPGKKTMFAVGRGAAYRIQMVAEGIRSRAK